MAKRFAETKIWEDVWYQELPIIWKVVWKYLCDRCDEAGIWKVNFRLADFQIGQKIKWDEADKYLNNGKIRILFNEDVWVIKAFVLFQYGEKIFKSNHVFHKKVVKMIDEGIVKTTRKKLTDKFKVKLFERDEYICQWCGEKYDKKDLVPDHFIPLSLGGDNSNNNLLTCCARCNGYKYNFHPRDFVNKNHSFINPTSKIKFMLDTLSDTLSDRVQEEEEEEVKVNRARANVSKKANP